MSPRKLRPIRIGCVGLGNQGRRDLREVTQRAQVTAICDTNPQRLLDVAQLCPNAHKTNSVHELLSYNDVDAIVISVADYLHAPIALQAIRSGRHCFCQKPLASSIEAAHELAIEARLSGLATQVGFQGLFHGRAARTLQLLRKGVIGEPIEVHAWAIGITPYPYEEWTGNFQSKKSEKPKNSWRWDPLVGTGVLGDLGSHALAMLFAAFNVNYGGNVCVVDAKGIFGYHPRFGIIDIQLVASNRPVPLRWYHGGAKPPQTIVDPIRLDDEGCIIIGTDGICYLPGLMNQYAYFLPRDRFEHFSPTDAGPTKDIYDDWLDGCFGNATLAPFWGFPLHLTETLLSGVNSFLTTPYNNIGIVDQ